jgi:hypothetical protein
VTLVRRVKPRVAESSPSKQLEGEEEVPPEPPNKALPAPKAIKGLLEHKYVFFDNHASNSRNENNLEATVKRNITLPMSTTIATSLLGALETTFATRGEATEPRQAVKKAWPGPWVRTSKKPLYIQKIAPL